MTDTTTDGLAALAVEIERLTGNAVVDRPSISLPTDLAEADHLLTYVARPGDDVQIRSLEHLLPDPVRPRGTYTVHDADSFVVLLTRVGTDETSVWAEQPSTGAPAPKLTAVINDVNPDTRRAPGWRDHRVELIVRPDPDWQAWASADGKWLDQVTFAEFLIDQTANIPRADEIYLAATTFEAARNITCNSVINLEDGTQQYQFVETAANGREKPGAVQLPREILVNLRPFFGADVIGQRVLLRHRVKDGKLIFAAVLHRPDLAVESAWAGWCEDIRGQIAAPLLQGTPPAPIAPIRA